MAFAHLHVHTEYSLLDGSNKIKEYVEKIKALGMTAGAITDHGSFTRRPKRRASSPSSAVKSMWLPAPD